MERRKGWRIAAVIGLSVLALTGCGQKTASHVEGLDALGEIQAYTREDDSGTRASWDDLLSVTSEAEDLAQAVSTEDMLKAVGSDASAIGYLSQDAADDSVKLLQGRKRHLRQRISADTQALSCLSGRALGPGAGIHHICHGQGTGYRLRAV